MLLTRYEVARVVGLRALQLENGASTTAVVPPGWEELRTDFIYLAALELHQRTLDAMVTREGLGTFHVRDARLPQELNIILDTRDRGDRGM